MNPIVVEKNGEITYTNYRGVKKQGIFFTAFGSVFACIGLLAFAGSLLPSNPEMAWLKGNVCMFVWILGFAGIMIWSGIYYIRRGKSFHVTVDSRNLKCNLGGRMDEIALRDIDEVLLDRSDGVKIYRGGKRVLEIPTWFFGSQAKEFVELLKARIESRGEIEHKA